MVNHLYIRLVDLSAESHWRDARSSAMQLLVLALQVDYLIILDFIKAKNSWSDEVQDWQVKIQSPRYQDICSQHTLPWPENHSFPKKMTSILSTGIITEKHPTEHLHRETWFNVSGF